MYNYFNPYLQDGGDPDGAMALGQIDAAIDKLQKLRQFIQPDSDLEPWVNSKLTLMDDYASSVSDYMTHNPEAKNMTQEPQGLPMPQLKNGGGIPERYKNMGFTKVGVKKNSTRPGKKWMVLAKKGDQYKVVHGGYDGMKDFSQHHSEKRKENFWNRMGGKNSSKATDPFSPLYWHKRFGTWEDGGEINMPEMEDGGSTFSGNAWYKMGGMPCYECGGMYAYGGIHIDPAKKGTFKAQATRMGMGVQEAASHILANKEDYSPAMVKKANFARNFAKEEGGELPQAGDGWIVPAALGALGLGAMMWSNNKRKQIGDAVMPMMMNGMLKNGGLVVGDELEVSKEELQMLKDGGYTFEII